MNKYIIQFKNKILPFLIILLPLIILLSIFSVYSVNVLFGDDWDIIWRLKVYKYGDFGFKDIFIQHNESRPVFPMLLMTFLSNLTDVDVRVQMLFSIFLMFLICILFWQRFKISINEKKTLKLSLFFLPISIMLFSLRQYENFFWGFQIIFILFLFFALISFIFFEKFVNEKKDKKKFIYFLSSILFAFMATFSMSSGLCIWLIYIFFLLLINNKINKKYIIILFFISLIIFAIYFFNYTKPIYTPETKCFLKQPIYFLQFFVALIGNSLVFNFFHNAFIIGIFLLFFLFYVLKNYKKVIKNHNKNIFWYIIILFSICNAILVSVGRMGYGISLTQVSRYSSLTIWLVIGIYVLLFIINYNKLNKLSEKVIISFFVIFILTLSPCFFNSLNDIKKHNMYREFLSIVLLNYESYSDEYLQILFPNVGAFRNRADFLKQNKLNVFKGNLNNEKELYQDFPKNSIFKISNQNIDIKNSKNNEKFLTLSGVIETNLKIEKLYINNNNEIKRIFFKKIKHVDFTKPVFTDYLNLKNFENDLFFLHNTKVNKDLNNKFFLIIKDINNSYYEYKIND